MGSRGRVGRSATVISLDIRSSLGFRIRFRFRVGIRCRIPHDTHGSVTYIYTLTGDTYPSFLFLQEQIKDIIIIICVLSKVAHCTMFDLSSHIATVFVNHCVVTLKLQLMY